MNGVIDIAPLHIHGAFSTSSTRMGRRMGMARWLACVVVVVVASGVAACDSHGQFREAEDAVKAELRDPGSAQFRKEHTCGDTQDVTGEVDAKNGYGGYFGYQTYVYAKGETALDTDTAKFIRLLGYCTADESAPANG
jgi:hypothetical protein